MKCPYCSHDNDRVVDSRASDDGYATRRRRECVSCRRRFTTYERIEPTSVKVVKRDGARIPFNRQKLRKGIELACWKRPIPEAKLDQIVAEIENNIEENFDSEVGSQYIGQMVMDRLRDLDTVAYVRFASVYRHFKDARDFADEVRPMLNDDGQRE